MNSWAKFTLLPNKSHRLWYLKSNFKSKNNILVIYDDFAQFFNNSCANYYKISIKRIFRCENPDIFFFTNKKQQLDLLPNIIKNNTFTQWLIQHPCTSVLVWWASICFLVSKVIKFIFIYCVDAECRIGKVTKHIK